jgi:hypothetical protein
MARAVTAAPITPVVVGRNHFKTAALQRTHLHHFVNQRSSVLTSIQFTFGPEEGPGPSVRMLVAAAA